MNRRTATILIAAATIASQSATAQNRTGTRDTMNPAALPAIFDSIDRNHDGRLTRAEVTAFGVSQHMGVTLREKAWREMDPNRDEKVTRKEFIDAALAYKAKREANAPTRR